jgi:signal peptidase I
MQFLSQKSSLKKLVKNHRRKILNVLVLLAAIAIGFLGSWFASKAILNTEYPIVPVSSGNMCVFQSNCDGLAHPFEPTLHVGDLIIVQGVNCSTVRVAYSNSDILVFHFPKSDSYDSGGLAITRVVAKEEKNGMIYFRTKGDGVGVRTWPEIPSVSECDRWYDYRENYTWNYMISEKLLVGKVVFRIPWIGYIALFVQNPSGILVIVMIIIIIILIVEFVIPTFTGKKAETKPKKSVKNALET